MFIMFYKGKMEGRKIYLKDTRLDGWNNIIQMMSFRYLPIPQEDDGLQQSTS